jgi:oligopeptide transport system substrate-binding protein
MKRVISFAVVLCLILVLFPNCWKTGDKADANSLILVLGDEPKTFDPLHITDMISIRVVAGLLEGLTVFNEKTLKPEAGIAEKWDISDDKLTYTFTLRKASWSNGDPVTVDDFVYSWKRILEPKNGAEYVYMLYPIKNAEKFNKSECAFEEVGIKAEGSTITITLEAPTPYFLDLTSFVTYLPVNRKAVEKHGEDEWTKPGHYVSNGAYLLETHHMKDRIVIKKNPTYYAAETIKLDKIIFRVIEDETMAYNEYKSGKVDIITDIPIPIYRRLKDKKLPDMYEFPSLGIYYVRFNVTKKPFNDKRVRKAIALAIDNKVITDKVLGAGQIPADSYVPLDTERKSSYAMKETFNPEKARKLLADAGYESGKGFPKIEYLYNTREDHKRVANAISGMLKKHLNIDMDLVNMEWKVYLKKMQNLEYDMIRSNWFGDYNDPMTFLDMNMTGNPNNRTGWGSEEYDTLIKQAFHEQDVVKRTEFFFKAESLLLDEELPVIPIYYYVSHYMVNKRVGGWYPNNMNWIRTGRLYIK